LLGGLRAVLTDLRWRMRDYVRGLLGQAARKNGWQLAEWAGHRTPLRRLLRLPADTTVGAKRVRFRAAVRGRGLTNASFVTEALTGVGAEPIF
jgi:hypothetical protein